MGQDNYDEVKWYQWIWFAIRAIPVLIWRSIFGD